VEAPIQIPIYLVCFHSAKTENVSRKAGQYLAVENAIRDGEWPYDNGDDPSFYVARRGGPLTWGVCRQDVRNSIVKDSIVVFFSFTPVSTDSILYRLCAVATVTDKMDHRAVHRSERFAEFRQLYINSLIHPQNDGWHYDESDRPSSDRHKDWLWRIADHRHIKKKKNFEKEYATIYQNEWFSESDVMSGSALAFGNNYVVFERAFILADPPSVALAVTGQHEDWTDERLRALTVGTASQLGNGRDYLRIVNQSERNVHRQIHFEMPADSARSWRETLIEALTRKRGRLDPHRSS